MGFVEVACGMTQPRISKGSRSGGRFARQPIAESPSFETVPELGDIGAPDDDDAFHSDDRSWMEISEEKREALLEETDRYLAELASKVGEPSAKHIARANALLDKLNGS